MKGKIVNLTAWRKEWAEQVFEWYESGEYPVWFRNIVHPAGIEAFYNYPALINTIVYGVFSPSIDGLLGLVAVYDYDINSRTASIGVMIRKEAQSLKFGTDCVVTIAKHLFETKNIRKFCIEFSGDDEKIIHMLNFMGSFLDPKITRETPIEKSPYFEGRQKKHMYINGKYHDKIMAACFKNQFDQMMEKYYGRNV